MKTISSKTAHIKTNDHAWIGENRTLALEKFESMEWPSPQEEEWRRTDLAGWDLDSYLEPKGDSGLQKDLAKDTGEGMSDRFRMDISKTASSRLRYSGNSCIDNELTEGMENQGVYLAPLGRALDELTTNPRLIQVAPEIREIMTTTEGDSNNHSENRLENRLESQPENRFEVWSRGAWGYGVVLSIPDGVSVPEPIFIEFDLGSNHLLSIPWIIVLLGREASCVVVTHFTGGENRALCNARTDIRLDAGSSLQYAGIQTLGSRSLFFHHEHAHIHRDAGLDHFSALFGAQMSKTRLDVDLKAPGGTAELSGIFFGDENQHMDLRTVQRHLSDHGVSKTFYSGAVDVGGRTIFQGLIEVSPKGFGTDAYLSNRNLVLTKGARADSIPSLKIQNNDVKCSHGSATGRINEDELYYLMARGIPQKEAEVLLVEGFFTGVIQKAPEPVTTDLERLVHEKLKRR